MAFYQLLMRIILPAAAIVILAGIIILFALAFSQNAVIPKVRRRGTPVHLLIVLGSGGHTTEMFFMLEKVLDLSVYSYRTYVVTSGDQFSAGKATEFEAKQVARQMEQNKNLTDTGSFDVVTIPRARRVHQSYWTAPFTTIQSFWACLLVLCGKYPDQQGLPLKYTSACPDIIITNGPAVSVCMIVAAKTLRFFIFISRILSGKNFKPEISRLRTIFVESWARISTLSTSGVLLLPLADRFLVQWPGLAGRRAWWGMKKTSYVGWAVL
ncbi:UDP-N-acetylglucosamine transferase subunit alg14 [Penicillium longicatenatum]|uniref:UDP-N-acetylglucosamine transferase subunit alg14 n=1 Tax=Penicillium longicatenatum TaxID=1561947 RepID=UPI0025487514|nr:UDP-N-acetylglucosamine transferase subunit alg14 [Penicillium longicatenatum]KAJ5650127.1 UDP-N-acetylglucosamine transferase subunit alg14 [Penicillium longicatenatum]